MHGSYPSPVTGLLTDLYELRMAESYLRRGMREDATFSLYIRPTHERPWFVALGIERVLEFIETYRFEPDELAYLATIGFSDAALDAFAKLECCGEVFAVEDGTVVLADEPIVEVTAPLPLAQLWETAIINLVQYPTLVATKAARVAFAAEGRPVVDFGFRRAHGIQTGIEAAYAAYVGGGLSTSNVEAGRRYGIPVVGTMAHAFIQSHATQLDAFRAWATDHPDNVTLLVDTYDTLAGVRDAIVLAGEGHDVRGVRLDSGDLVALSKAARDLLDEADLERVQIFASGGLDEYKIAELVRSGAAIDAFGVGTDLVVSGDRPAAEIAYKLVSYAGRDVVKSSLGKESLAGAKQIFRRGDPTQDVLALRDESFEGQPLLKPVWRDGERLCRFDLSTARERASAELAAIPTELRRPEHVTDVPRPATSDRLRELTESLRHG
jgi:nicotinate phosphoribosyltransferase